MRRLRVQEWVAAAVMAVVLGLIALDVLDDSVNSWFDGHSFTTDAVSTLLGLAVAALVIDRVAEARSMSARSRVVAVQAAAIAAQARRSIAAFAAARDSGAELNSAAEELRTLTAMTLVSTPVLMDVPETRVFLEETQRLAGTLAQTVQAARAGAVSDELTDALDRAAARVREAVRPLLAMLESGERAVLTDQLESVGN